MKTLLLLLAAQVHTQSITVTPAPHIDAAPAAATATVGADELEERQPLHVMDALEHVPGVLRRGEGAPSVPVIRGLSGGRTLLLLDDARVVAERRAGPSATFIDPFVLGAIEIARGPGAVAYGSDALGGIVHMRYREPLAGVPELRYTLSQSFGGDDTSGAGVSLTRDAFGGAMLLALHAREADEQHSPDGPIANSSSRDRGAILRFVRGGLRAGLAWNAARDVGALSSDTVYPDEDSLRATLAYDTPIVKFRAAFGTYGITTKRGDVRSTVDAKDASISVAANVGRFTAGADFVSRFDLTSPGAIDDAQRIALGLFANGETRVHPQLRIHGGARVDRITAENRGGFFGDRDAEHLAWSGQAAATAGPFRGVTATLQLASGFRDPSLSDRYFRGISGRGFAVGNPDLDPERSLQLDTSVRWAGSRAQAALYGYRYRIRDLVERYRDGDDFRFRNRGEADIRGVEFEVSTRLVRDFSAQLGAAIASGEADDGAALDDIAPPTIHATLRWSARRASAYTTLSAFARDDDPGPVEAARAGYASIELGGGYRISERLELRVAVRNAGDRRYFASADAASGLAPGRSVVIALSGR